MYEDEIPVGKAKDLRGQKFGRWTVLYRTYNKNKQVYWKVRCECGTEKAVYGQTLLNGQSKSCGCDTKNLISQALKENLVGQRFGRLVVIKEDFSKNRVAYKCKCDCGNEIVIQSGNLKSGHTQSCGCRSIEMTKERNAAKLLGQTFGKLTIMKEAYRKNFQVFWECQCECGNITYIPSGHLLSGHTKSCGCLVSSGEMKISMLLNEYGIDFTTQKSFNAYYPKDKEKQRVFRFDFYIDNHYLIEFDGIQHYKPVGYFGGEERFKIQQERDDYKNQWCRENNIPLIRIPYWKLDTLCIEDLMLETTKFRVV